jgi:spectrin beta
MVAGEELIKAGHFGSDRVQHRLQEVEEMWQHLVKLMEYRYKKICSLPADEIFRMLNTFRILNRKRRLTEAVDFHQFLTDADDVDTWMLDLLRIVSSDDIGKDESNVQTLLKKHKDITDELRNYSATIDALHEQAQQLGESDKPGNH